MQQANIEVIYHWDPKDGGLTPEVLGDSIKGFGSVFKDLLKLSGVSGPVSVRVEVAKEGSIIIGFAVEVAQRMIFSSWQSLFDFYAFVGAHDALRVAKEFAALRDDLNAYFAKNAFDAFVLAIGIPRLMDWAKKQKKAPTVIEENGKSPPKQYAVGLHKMIKRGAYKKAMCPFIENEIKLAYSASALLRGYRMGYRSISRRLVLRYPVSSAAG